MNYLIAILFGIIQGVTEFLPVSSSGHLVMLHNMFELPINDVLVFDVFLNFASLLAVVYFFRCFFFFSFCLDIYFEKV